MSHGDREPGDITEDFLDGAGFWTHLGYALGVATGVGVAMGLVVLLFVALVKGSATLAEITRNIGGNTP